MGFYDKVMTQEVTQTKAKDAGNRIELSTKRTQRKIGKILFLVQHQFVEFLKGKFSVQDLNAAMRDKQVKQTIQKHMTNENIRLMRKDTNEPVFRRECTLIGEHGDQAEHHYDDANGLEETHLEPDEAHVQVDSQAFEEVKNEVSNFIARAKTNN